MKKVAATFLSAVMLTALLAAPALARDRNGYRAWRGPDGWHEYYGGERYEFYENHPQWAWNRAEWREHHDWDDHWRWQGPDSWFHRGYDRR
jgi:hypothetical protein